MCGISGILDAEARFAPDELAGRARAMSRTLHHRGPDQEGAWSDGDAGIALAHRRLSIVDLSDAGAQPMTSSSGRWILIFNGEIYNFQVLRRELEAAGWRFRGHSDTEVLLALVEAHGFEHALERTVGMFAIALWDRITRQLHLARDRMGKKPLYIACRRGLLLFASELKAFHAVPGFEPAIDGDALSLMMRHAYVPDPYCIFEGCAKLAPGSILSLRARDLAHGDAAALIRRAEPYWSLPERAEAGQRALTPLGDREATDALDGLLRQVTGERMVADVPLGAFLSGGLDSSTVVAQMQAQSHRPVRTFTIGFEEEGQSEADDARAVARHLGTDHTELTVTAEEALAVIPELPRIYDEPFADQSQIPTFLVSRLARQHVTVALSGDGGDESFGGYVRYLEALRLNNLYRLPRPLRQTVADGLVRLPPDRWTRALRPARALTPRRVGEFLDGRTVHKLASVLGLADGVAMYNRYVSQWLDPAEIVRGGRIPPTALTAFDWHDAVLGDLRHKMMLLDSITYLPGDILVKVDRASMAVSLEARAPLLDHRVVEFAWGLPIHQKIRGHEGKWLLRRVLERYVPASLFDRPKRGFGVPIQEWLRGPLRDWAEALLDPHKLEQQGLFHARPIREAWARHCAGSEHNGYALWNVLMFQAWHDAWKDRLATAPPAPLRPELELVAS